ncbi:hypothetical protein [Terriglobus albidus]|uniref:hypothetical protein n=1 Tax=Terriglobus albidus TaxID=1592106 RepID=UPI0021E0DB21|nr:hypothetical protein [Terriglobus albidus]
MKRTSILRSAIALPFALSVCAFAQMQVSRSVHCTDDSSGPCTVTTTGVPAEVGIVSVGGPMSIQGHAEVVTGRPYTAQAVTELKQTLSNGAHITQKSEASVGRDSKGRTFRVQTMNSIGPWTSTGEPTSGGTQNETAPTLTTIFDPVSKTHIDYTDNPKRAHVIPLGDFGGPVLTASVAGGSPNVAFVAGEPAGGAVGFATQTRVLAAPGTPAKEPEAEQLGERQIEGFKAVGKRTRVVIPANSIGNDSPIEITHETWYSPELKLILESTQNDPRFGETKYALVKISAKEPSEKLFQVPAGYTVEEVPEPPPLR